MDGSFYKVVDDIKLERMRQDDKWGGPEHDDGHDTESWFQFIARQMFKRQNPGISQRDILVKVAALAVAAIQSIDRKATK